MFRAWKDAILSHYSLYSGKGVKELKTPTFLQSQHSPL